MTALAINRPRRRGACPGLSAPMPTGDGLLVRLMPTATIPLAAFIHLCGAARQHGNGIIEITGRGSVQVRGLNAASAPRFADAIATLDIAAQDGIPVLSNALSGLDAEEIFDAGILAAELRHALVRGSLAARLAPKVSVAIDGGGTINLDGVSADVRLRAELSNGNVALRVGVGGDGASQTQCGLVAPSHGVEAAMRLLDVVAQRGRDIRARDLLAAEDATPFRSVVSDLLVDDTPPSHGRGCGETIGQHRLRNGSLAYGIGLAFGHADAATLERLAEAADAAGASGIRLAAGRALMIIGLSRETVSAFVTAAERYGFIVHADDPRRRVVACAGAPICSSAYIAARTIAPLVANVAAPHLDGSRQVHISGCAKGCAHTGSAAVTVVGLPDGCAVIVNGSAHDAPLTIVATEELPPVIARLAREAGEGAHV